MGTVTLLEEEGKSSVCSYLSEEREWKWEWEWCVDWHQQQQQQQQQQPWIPFTGISWWERGDNEWRLTDWKRRAQRKKMKRGMTLPQREEEGSFYLSCHCTHVSEYYALCVLSDNRKEEQHWAELSTLNRAHTTRRHLIIKFKFVPISFLLLLYCHCRLFCLPTCFISFRRHCQQQQRQTEQQKNY